MINKSIEIYDNTINQTTINILKEIIRQPEETNMYTQHRNPVIDRTKNIECKLGLFIHELLLQINDNTKYLEYWIHTDNKGIGFHRDCDDELLSKKNILLIPEKAHILYLDNDVYCPTMILNDNNKWVEASPEQQREIASSTETKNFLEFNPNNYNTIIGFIGYEKGNKDLAFKTKNMSSKRDTGARCDQATKSKNLAKLNEIIGENKYTIESTKVVKDKDGNIIQEAMGNDELCVLEEFILRYFNMKTENGKKWFFTPEMAIYHKLYTVLV